MQKYLGPCLEARTKNFHLHLSVASARFHCHRVGRTSLQNPATASMQTGSLEILQKHASVTKKNKNNG